MGEPVPNTALLAQPGQLRLRSQVSRHRSHARIQYSILTAIVFPVLLASCDSSQLWDYRLSQPADSIVLVFDTPHFAVRVFGVATENFTGRGQVFTDNFTGRGQVFVAGKLAYEKGVEQFGDFTWERQYENGVLRIVLAEQLIVIDDRGQRVNVNGNAFHTTDLFGKTIVVDRKHKRVIRVEDGVFGTEEGAE